ncbi:hypothetical protein ACQEVB_38945 [Pseudonocardia sp. CA-107938]|uniref:hypothetical protein n=1 Tax=Pseudonocardia sp. CA-107938 TaxID=3240021 RepID=UPI003D8BB997
MSVAGLLWAALAAVLNTVAGLLQSDATRFVTRRRPLARQPRYLAGLAVDGLGWLSTVAALQRLPVVLVQSVLGCAIVLTVYASRVRYGTVLRRQDHAAALACAVGLALVAAGTSSDTQVGISGWTVLAMVAAAVLLVTGVVAVWDGGRGWPLGVLAGLAFGGSALAVRAGHLDVRGVVPGAVTIALVAAFWLTGLAAHARALELTGVARLTAIVLVTETVLPGLAGILLLGDAVRPGWVWPLACGLALAMAGMLVLTGSPALRPPPTTALRGLRRPHPSAIDQGTEDPIGQRPSTLPGREPGS